MKFFYADLSDMRFEGESPNEVVWETYLFPPQSTIFFCKQCGNIYARLVCQGTDWCGIGGTCRSCPPPPTHTEVPGSIINLCNLHNLLPALPDVALVREFTLHVDFYSRK